MFMYRGPPQGPRIEIAAGADAAQRLLDAPLSRRNVWFTGAELTFEDELPDTVEALYIPDTLRRSPALRRVRVATSVTRTGFQYMVLADLRLDELHIDVRAEFPNNFGELGRAFSDTQLSAKLLSVRMDVHTAADAGEYAALAGALASIPPGRVAALQLELPNAVPADTETVMNAVRAAHVERFIHADGWSQDAEVYPDPGYPRAAAAAVFAKLAGETRFHDLYLRIAHGNADTAAPLAACLATNRGIRELTLECGGPHLGALLEAIVGALRPHAENNPGVPDPKLTLLIPAAELADVTDLIMEMLGGNARIRSLCIGEVPSVELLRSFVTALMHNTRLRAFEVPRHPDISASNHRPFGNVLQKLGAKNTGLLSFGVRLPAGKFSDAVSTMLQRNATRPRADVTEAVEDPVDEIAALVVGPRAAALYPDLRGLNPHGHASTAALLDATTAEVAAALQIGLAALPPPADVDERVLADFVVPAPAGAAVRTPGFRAPAHTTDRALLDTGKFAIRFIHDSHGNTAERFLPFIDAVIYAADEAAPGEPLDLDAVLRATGELYGTPLVISFPPGAPLPPHDGDVERANFVVANDDEIVDAVRALASAPAVQLSTLLFYREMLRPGSPIVTWAAATEAATRCRMGLDGAPVVTDAAIAASLDALSNAVYVPGRWVILDRARFVAAVHAWGKFASFSAALAPDRRAELCRNRSANRADRRAPAADAAAAFRALLYRDGAGDAPEPSDAELCDILAYFRFLRRIEGTDDVQQMPGAR